MMSDDVSIDQLEVLLQAYPQHASPLVLEGLILDYVGRTGEPLDEVFNLNPKIYYDLFVKDGSDREGRRLLLAIVRDEKSQRELLERCKKNGNWQKVIDILEPVILGKSEESSPKTLNSGEKRRAVLLHLSDVHFGKFNRVDSDPRELAFILVKLTADYPDFRPSLVLISGDISSVAAPTEFESFATFCTTLSQELWGSVQRHRILVVPGNHDVSWHADGTADRMVRFAESVGASPYCLTPFGAIDESLDDGKVAVRRRLATDTSPPICEVTYSELGLRFILLVSGYFAGEVPKDIRDALLCKEDTDSAFRDLLRCDDGAINREYLAHLASFLEESELDTIGLIHHNPIGYGVELCTNKHAQQLLRTLRRKGVCLLMHGHTHQVDDRDSPRQPVPNDAFPVPCPTFTSIPSGGSGRGVNFHLVSDNTSAAMGSVIRTIVWPMSNSESFIFEHAVERYRFDLQPEGVLVVTHAS